MPKGIKTKQRDFNIYFLHKDDVVGKYFQPFEYVTYYSKLNNIYSQLYRIVELDPNPPPVASASISSMRARTSRVNMDLLSHPLSLPSKNLNKRPQRSLSDLCLLPSHLKSTNPLELTVPLDRSRISMRLELSRKSKKKSSKSSALRGPSDWNLQQNVLLRFGDLEG